MKKETLDAFVAAQLKALGIEKAESLDDSIYDRLVVYCKKHRIPATAARLEESGEKRGTIHAVLQRLVASRRALKVAPGKYIPVVKP